jgi:hypothetical protein
MNRLMLTFLFMIAVAISQVYGQLAAEQITKANANRRLFAGTDANGGIGDWYLSNGVVQIIVDNVGFNPDIAATGTNRPLQTLIAPSGGNLVDIGLSGKNNDQFNLLFSVANLDPNNAFFYTGIRAETTATQARIIVDGILLFTGISTLPGTGGPGPTLIAQTVYSLAPQDRFLTMTTTVTNAASNPVPVFNITDAVPTVNRSSLPFAPFPGRGFNNPRLVLTPAGIASALGAYPFVTFPGNVSPQDGLIDTVNNQAADEVSYSLAPVSLTFDPDGSGPAMATTMPLPSFIGVTSGTVSALGNAFDPARSPQLPAGGTLTYTRRIYVGDRNDVAASADLVYQNLFPAAALGTLTGDVNALDNPDVKANVLIEGKLSSFFGNTTLPITQVQTDDQGRFQVTLPAGEYTLRILSPEREDGLNIPVTVAPATMTVASLPALSAVGNVEFTVQEGGTTIPAKLTFVGLDNTPAPNFSRFFTANIFDPQTNQPIFDYRPETFTGAPAANFLFTTSGQGRQSLKPGRYQIIASRGLEYTISQQTITVTAGQTTPINFNLERVIDTTGYVSADFHVHAAPSFDSSVPIEDRVRSFVAENVEVLVSTEHNFIADYAPAVRKLNVGNFIKTIIGNELTTSLPNPVFPQSVGHHIAFPLLVKPDEPRRGAPQTEYVPPATFYDRSRMNNPGVPQVIQLNHPRTGTVGLTLIGLFNIVNFSPTKSLPAFFGFTSQLNTGTRNIDFNAMELYNGSSIGEFQTVRNDWFSLINQGFLKTATAVSDSHRAVIEAPGFPTSYVASPTDNPTAVRDEMVTSAVLNRNLLGTSGPFIRFDVNGQPIGSLVRQRQGRVTLNITVSAPAWVPVEEVRIYENGRLVRSFDATTNPMVRPAPADVTSNQGVERFRAAIKLKPRKKDVYYTVEAGVRLPRAIDLDGDGVLDTGDTNGDGQINSQDQGFVQPLSPPIYQQIAPGFVPLAFTNPIFIDRNGNRRFDPPGVAATVVDTAAEPQPLAADAPDALKFDHHHDLIFPWQQLQITPEVMQLFWQFNLFPLMEKLQQELETLQQEMQVINVNSQVTSQLQSDPQSQPSNPGADRQRPYRTAQRDSRLSK